MNLKGEKKSLRILLADDDKDDRFFFERALKHLSIKTSLTTVSNGEQLMDYLRAHASNLPDILFLDLNMPRKNGFECLEEIKADKEIARLPIIIYSTSLNNMVADVLYQKGAHYYIQKNVSDLKEDLWVMFQLLESRGYKRPPRQDFVIDFVDYA
jgi:CheY-like chemotaxis protein